MTSFFSSRHSSKPSSSRRRLTSPSTGSGNDDLFLNLANDAPDNVEDTKSVLSSRGPRRKVSPRPHRHMRPVRDITGPSAHAPRQSIPTPSRRDPASAGKTETASRNLENATQPNSVPPPPRRANTDAILHTGSASALARSTAARQHAINGDSPRERIQSQQRRQSLGLHTPSSSRNNTLRPSDFAYSTPEAFDKATRDNLQPKSSFHVDGLESEVSTTAPSTVWEELTELKARMKRLEHGGNAVKSRQNSNTAAELNERPRTGTTQTTASTRRSSHTEHLSPATTKITAPDSSDLHPLLQSALAKSRNVVGRGVYQALENTASDALQLAILARSEPSDAVSAVNSTADGTSFSQKRILRKADSLCRDLTELCIALCEAQTNGGSPLEFKAPYRPGSRDHNGDAMSAAETNSPLTSFEERRKLADRFERLNARYGNNANGRIADRRDFTQSTVLANRLNGRQASVTDSSPTSPWASAGLNRAATTASNHSRPPTRDSSANETSPDRDATLRGPIRSNTDARQRPIHSSRGSREYTSQHPLPAQNQSTNSLSSNRTIQPGDRNSGMLSPTSTETPTGIKTPLSPSSSRRRRAGSNASSRAPPSASGLAERLEASRKSQQVASAQQLRGQEDSLPSPARPDGQSQPPSSGRRMSRGRVMIDGE